MRTRSSASTEEDDSDDTAVPEPRLPDDDGRKRSFTSAKYDVTRHSVTLDRRKGDKGPPTSPTLQNAWTVPTASSEKQKEVSELLIPSSLKDTMANHWSHQRSRVQSPWRCSLLTLATTATAMLFFFAIIHSFFTRQLDPKGCNNCMMMPAYAKLPGFDTEHTRFASKYSLYLYREGQIDEDTMVKGVPVLFIPGNAGSYKQVRPIAAEAAHYFHNDVQSNADAIRAGTRNLDFFTVDFNEDITAFHGQTLLDQAEYLNEATAYILSLYHDPRRSRRDPGLPDPSSVILVGHSMGGVVARTMLTMPNYQSNSINTIITMSAPHARAPVSFDSDIVHTYERINTYWRQAYSQKWANNNPLWHVTLISIAGGGLDTVVPSDYACLSSLVPDTHGFTVFTSTVPNVWTGADHLSILWCDQFRKVIVRSLIEAVDVHRPSQTKPRAERMRIFKRWFLTGLESVAEKTLPQKEPTTLLTLEDNSNAIIGLGERLVLRGFGEAGRANAHLIPVPPQGPPGGQKFTLLSDQPLDPTGAGGKMEVLFCSIFPLQAGQSAALLSMNIDLSGTSSGSTRLACKNAASDVIHLPASTRTSKYSFDDSPPFSYLQYNLEDLAEHQFVAVVDKMRIPSNGWVVAEFSENARSVIHTGAGLRKLLAWGLRITLPADRPLVMDIKIPALLSSLLAYKLSIGTQVCGEDAELFTPLLRQYLSEPYESKYFVNVKEANINLHGIAPFMPPLLRGHAIGDGVSLQLWTDPTCNTSVSLSLKVDVPGSMGKLHMRYRTVFAAFPLVIVALVLRKQFRVHDETGVFMSFAESLDLCLRSSLPLLFIAMSLLAMSLATMSAAPARASSFGLFGWRGNATESAVDFTKNDLLLGSSDPFFWFLVPLYGLVCAGICVLVNYAALAITSVLCLVYSTLTARPAWIKNDDRRYDFSVTFESLGCTDNSYRRATVPAFPPTSPRRRIIITLLLLLLVSTLIPYQFAYMVACIVQIATCTRALRFAQETVSFSDRCPTANFALLIYVHQTEIRNPLQFL